MSAAPSAQPDRQQPYKSPDYMRVLNLVKQIGSKNGFEPIPWDQLSWHQRRGMSPMQRMWCWMISKTLKKGHWSPYAITKAIEHGGEELHIEHAAQALGMDPGNAYKTWKDGLSLGLWRNGTKDEGKRRLYICGSVPQPVGEDKAKDPPPKIVCTDNLPPYILKQIKDWPPEKRIPFDLEWARRVTVRETVLAETVTGARDILDAKDTTFLRGWQLEIRRNDDYKRKDLTAKQIQARRERAKLILPQLQNFVQTIESSVQSGEIALYKAENRVVQTVATLLPETSGRKKKDTRAGGVPDRVSRPVAAHQAVDGTKDKYQPAGQLPELSDLENQALILLFFGTARMQEAFPHTDFASEKVDPKNKADQIWARRVLHTVGADNMTGFILSVASKFKGLDHNALAKLPSRAPGTDSGPRSLGLILAWAKDYGRRLSEAARPPEVSPQDRAEEIRACRSILADQNVDPKAKAIARDTLRAYGQKVDEVKPGC